MSRFTAWIALLILIGSVWSQEQLRKEKLDESSPRFGFDLLDPIRMSFCNSSCMSAETMPYLMNLACAVKCPELYLPHGTSSSTMTSSEKPSTDSMSTTSTSSDSTTSSTTTTTSSTPSTITAKP